MKQRRVKCDEVAKHICDNLDSQLDTPKCRSIRKHIRECPNCCAYLDSVKKTIHLYRVEPTPHVTAKAHRRLMSILKLQ